MKKIKAVLISSALLLASAGSVFAQSPGITIIIDKPENAPGNIGRLLSSTISFIFIFTALAAFIYLIWGGIQWITSGGDKSATEAARNRIQAAILGLFIVFAAWAIMLVVGGFFNIDLTNLRIPSPFGN